MLDRALAELRQGATGCGLSDLELIAALSAVAARGACLDAGVTEALRLLGAAAGFAAGHAWIPSTDDTRALVSAGIWLEPGFALHAPLRADTRCRRVHPGEDALGQALGSGAPVWVDAAAGTALPVRAHIARACGFDSILILPVCHGADVVGLIELLDPDVRAPAPERLDTLALGARQLGPLFAQRRVDAETARLAGIVESTGAAIVTQDTRGRVTGWNRAAEQLLGYQADEMAGQSLDALDPRGAPDDSRALLERSLAAREVQHVEVQRLARDGTPVDVLLTVSPLLGADGEPIGVSTVAHDDTERKNAQAALERAKLASEEATRLKSEFLANMSHEIRTPMNGVIGMTELLGETDLDPVQREYTETVRRSADHLLSVINDVLDFSKIEAGKLDLESIPFDLAALVEDTCALLGERARSKGLELLCFVQSEVPRGIVGDPTRLAQVLTNLVGNAIKFTNRGEVVVRVTELTGDGRRSRVHFEVEDTGIGITAEQQRRLFEPFAQGDGSTTRRFGGSGLGLSISSQLVELMGSALQVRSEPGHGSTFGFTVDFEHRPVEGLEAWPGAGLEGFRVLVVDDNVTNCAILSHHLEAWGVAHDVVGDAGRALDLMGVAALRGVPYGLAIIDRSMPGVDGLELARRIRNAPALAGTCVVMLSSGNFDRAEATEAGVELCLSKPVRASRLHDALADVLARSRGESRATAPAITPRHAGAALPSLQGRVLLAEDNAVNRKVALGMLKRLGLEAEVARNGREALQALEAGRFDVVLMDCQMPELDGLEATRELRARSSDSQSRTPVIAMTANAMEGDRERCLAAGMDDYLAKPVKLGPLAQCLEQWIGTRRSPPHAAARPHAPGPARVEPAGQSIGNEIPEP